MAEGTKLVIQYATATGDTINHTWNYANGSASTAAVKALAGATITNGSIFTKVPVLTKSAKLVTTTESEYDLDE